jgi:hypothetical protein
MTATTGGGGCHDSRGQRLCGSPLTSETPLFVPRRAAVISPQRHQVRTDNSQGVSGDGFSPSPGPLCLGGEDLCETNPIALERMEWQILGKKGVMMNWTREEPWQNKANFVRPGPVTRGTSEEVGRGRPTYEESVVRNKASFRWAGYPTIPPFQCSNPMPIVRNKANSWGRTASRDRAFATGCRPHPASQDRELTIDRAGAGY